MMQPIRQPDACCLTANPFPYGSRLFRSTVLSLTTMAQVFITTIAATSLAQVPTAHNYLANSPLLDSVAAIAIGCRMS